MKKLVNVKHKLTVVSNILQSSEERLLKLKENIAKDVNSQNAQLALSNTKEITNTGPDESSIL